MWNLALACAGQLRIAPGGAVLGFDQSAVLAMAAAQNVSSTAGATLLPAIEVALVDAVNAERDQDA